ncbi:MAG: SpoIIE family protein phosphatase [Formivibrio sp.]|nr:SpoIIE family protein phosphatase [Formivibrio sp.]
MLNAGKPVYEYAVASRALTGERQSGDASLVQATNNGVLIAVVDGLGHGNEAAEAAATTINILREYANEPIISLFQRCHENLQKTRGAVMALAALESTQSMLTWAGIGNIEAILIASRQDPLRKDRYLTNRNGVVGYRLPAIETKSMIISPGDLLVFATDGIHERFLSEEFSRGAPDQLARLILERHGKTTDDALVLVLRWLGCSVVTEESNHHAC